MSFREPAEPPEGDDRAEPALSATVLPLFDAASPPPPSRLGRWVADPGDETAASLGTPVQWLCLLVAASVLISGLTLAPAASLAVVRWSLIATFLSAVLWRLVLVFSDRVPHDPEPLPDHELPQYTVICPLFREAEMVAPLLKALEAIDYPRDRLQILIALERGDAETREAVLDAERPPHVRIVLAPPGLPRTKARACNVALARATGDLLVIYDAEDRPHPQQLREAAARFATADDELACLQAPLRILPRRAFLHRQFAIEYAAQFEVVLHGLAGLGLPLPLGGTSNHFRVDRLREVGGWDPWNVTEDADLGFRLARRGWRTGTLRRPTVETPPETYRDWGRQRTRWLKGYYQTLIVATRRPMAGGAGGLFALWATLGLAAVSALLHGLIACAMAAQLAYAIALGGVDGLPWVDLAVLMLGWWSACLLMRRGARRAGFRANAWDYVCAFLYWPLLTPPAFRAILHLIFCPHLWEKTPHHPPETLIDWTRCEAAD